MNSNKSSRYSIDIKNDDIILSTTLFIENYNELVGMWIWSNRFCVLTSKYIICSSSQKKFQHSDYIEVISIKSICKNSFQLENVKKDQQKIFIFKTLSNSNNENEYHFKAFNHHIYLSWISNIIPLLVDNEFINDKLYLPSPIIDSEPNEDQIKELIEMIKTIFIDEFRYLEAKKIYDKVVNYIEKSQNKYPSLSKYLPENNNFFQCLNERSQMVNECIKELQHPPDESWSFSQTYSGISTFYKRIPSEPKLLYLRSRGTMTNLPQLIYPLCIIKELGFYTEWVPFVKRSEILNVISPVEMLGYFYMNIPFLPRDSLIHAFAIDVSHEYEGICIIASSVDNQCHLNTPCGSFDIDFGNSEKGWLLQRSVFEKFHCYIKAISQHTAQVEMLCAVDLHVDNLPQTLVDFVIHHVAGLLLSIIYDKTMEVQKDYYNDKPNVFLNSIYHSQNTHFYLEFLRPRISYYFSRVSGPSFVSSISSQSTVIDHLPSSYPHSDISLSSLYISLILWGFLFVFFFVFFALRLFYQDPLIIISSYFFPISPNIHCEKVDQSLEEVLLMWVQYFKYLFFK